MDLSQLREYREDLVGADFVVLDLVFGPLEVPVARVRRVVARQSVVVSRSSPSAAEVAE